MQFHPVVDGGPALISLADDTRAALLRTNSPSARYIRGVDGARYSLRCGRRQTRRAMDALSAGMHFRAQLRFTRTTQCVVSRADFGHDHRRPQPRPPSRMPGRFREIVRGGPQGRERARHVPDRMA